MKIMVGFLFLVGIVLLLVIVVGEASGETIIVAKDGGDYEKIQDAIDVAKEGDTIRVWEGTYYENVVVDKSVSLIGNGNEETTIDGGGNGSVVRISADWVNISGFMVTESETGITLDSSSYCMIMNNICYNNDYGGIELSSSNYCTLKNNICSANYRGITLVLSSNCTLANNTCTNNNDIGIWLGWSWDCTIENNNCSNNTYGISLGGESDRNTITNNTISENEEWGIYLCYNSKDNIAHYNNIFGNTDYGVYADSTSFVNATNNWWGHEFGPYHTINNTEGKGDNVTNYVLFNPWLRRPDDYFPPKAIIDTVSPDFILEGDEIHFHGHGIAYNSINGYAWRSSLDSEFYNGTESGIESNGLSNGTHTIYFKVQDNIRVWSDEVSYTLTVNGKPRAYIDSISPESAVEGQIVTLEGHGTDDGSIERYAWRTQDIELYNGTNSSFNQSNLSVGTHSIFMKVQDNYDVWSDEVNTTLVIIEDTEQPTILIASHYNKQTVKGDVTISGNASDNIVIENVEYRIGVVGGWLSAIGTTSWSFTLNTNQLEDGEYILEFRAYDGKQYSEIANLTIIVNNKQESTDNSDDEDFYSFLFEYLGPLPLIGYVGIVLMVAIVGIAAGKKRKKKEGTAPDAVPSQPSAPGQYPPQVLAQYQQLQQPTQYPQQPQYYPQTLTPQQPQQPTQYPQTQVPQQPQQYPQAPQAAPQQSDSSWFCAKCGTKQPGDFVFCMSCGYKRES